MTKSKSYIINNIVPADFSTVFENMSKVLYKIVNLEDLFFFSRYSVGWVDEDERDDSDCENMERPDSSRAQYKNSSSGNIFHGFPDLTPAIDLHFHSRSPETRNNSTDFSRFEKFYEEHRKILQDDEEYRQRHGRKTSDCAENSPSSSFTKNKMIRSPSYTETSGAFKPKKHCRNLSAGSIPVGNLSGYSASGVRGSVSGEEGNMGQTVGGTDEEVPPIWCLECQDALIIVGCGSGRIEVWDLYNNVLKVRLRAWLSLVYHVSFLELRILVYYVKCHFHKEIQLSEG